MPDGTNKMGKSINKQNSTEEIHQPVSAQSLSTGSVLFNFGDKLAPEEKSIIRVTTSELKFSDRLGSWKARWAIGRMSYTVPPGLYALGKPSEKSHVFVSANYKMSFDRLRSQLGRRDCWILVLDTKGINVWCAAGKGTFGTFEIVNRIRIAGLHGVVSHRKLILPQLGAPGVSAHEVKRATGFTVIYGPVRAEDLPEFLDNRLKATPEMRRVKFGLRDRIVLIPTEIVLVGKWATLAIIAFMFLSGIGPGMYSLKRAVADGLLNNLLLLWVLFSGTVLTPVLLPFLPGRAFWVKGLWVGLICVAGGALFFYTQPDLYFGWLSSIAWILIGIATTSFLAMNFTGSTPYTSMSGVVKEMKIALPVQIISAFCGLCMWVVSRFIHQV